MRWAKKALVPLSPSWPCAPSRRPSWRKRWASPVVQKQKPSKWTVPMLGLAHWPWPYFLATAVSQHYPLKHCDKMRLLGLSTLLSTSGPAMGVGEWTVLHPLLPPERAARTLAENNQKVGPPCHTCHYPQAPGLCFLTGDQCVQIQNKQVPSDF